MTLPPGDGPDRSGPAWHRRLAGLLERGGLRSAYQPILDVAAGTITGYEALARFDEPGLGVEEWFEAARRLGMGDELEAAALASALSVRPDLPANCFLTINVSPGQLAGPAVRRVLGAADLAGVVIELTEQAVVESYGELEVELRRWRAAGALIAVDDAGSGYAGLRHLLELRPAIIKLDRALVDRVDRDPAKRVLIEMIGTFADRTDAWLLAEGIERIAELDAVADLGVPLAQGYLIARPAPPWAALGEAAAWAEGRARREPPAPIGTVAAHARRYPTACDVPEAAALLGADGELDWVVVTDRRGRPLSVAGPASALAGTPEAAIRVGASTPVAQALQRAMARPADERFAPLLVVDEAGGYVGLATVERLVEHLAAVGA